MAEITNGFFDALKDPKAAMWSAGVAFNRSNPLPLDRWSVFQTMAEAETYAESNAVAYPGQLIAAVDNGKMVAMVLAEDAEAGKLVPQQIGIIPTGEGAVTVDEETGKISIGIDGVTIEVVEGKLTLVGFADAEDGAQLVKQNGELVWVKPDVTTVEGLQTTVNSLDLAVKNLNTTVGEHTTDIGELESRIDALDAAETGRMAVVEANIEALEEKIGDAESGIAKDVNDLNTKTGELEGDINSINLILEQKANAADVYTKSEVYTTIEVNNAIEVAIAAADHLRYKIVTDINEDGVIDINDIDLGAEDADRFIYLVPAEEEGTNDLYDEYMVLEGGLEKVGSWEVDLSDYAKASQVLALEGTVQGLQNSLSQYAKTEDVNNALNEKANTADVENTLKDYAKTESVSNSLNSLKLALEGQIENKVDAAEGYGLISDTNITKLEGIEEGAEVNYISSVDENQLKVEGKKLSIIDVKGELVTGLTNAAGEEAGLQTILDEKALKTSVDSQVLALQNAIDDKVSKNGTDRLITEEEGKKLSALVVGEGGKVEISGTVNASNVQELYNAVNTIVTGTGVAEYDGLEKQLLGIEAGAQANKIENITINGTALPIAGKIVDIPVGAESILGVVKGSSAENKIAIATDGTMEVNSLNVNKLV
jgi:hypothetical protein